jgi:hypothetical protein
VTVVWRIKSRPQAAEELKFVMWLPSTMAFGTVTNSFLIVWTRVASRVFSTTSPTVSAILTRSPTRNAQVYVRMVPATTFATADVDPKENRTPRKMEIPRKAGESEPGKYGKITTAVKASIRNRTIL